MEVVAKPMQATDDPGRAERRDNLYEPKEDLSERSSLGGPRRRGRSLLLDAQMNPGKTAAVVMAGLAAMVGAALAGARQCPAGLAGPALVREPPPRPSRSSNRA